MSFAETDRAIEVGELDAALHESFSSRHPSVKHFETLFEFKHLQRVDLQNVSMVFADAAVRMLALLEDGPELSTALRKLREAKDCAVTQCVIDGKKAE